MTKEDFIKKFPDIKVQQFETETIWTLSGHIQTKRAISFLTATQILRRPRM